MSSVKSISQSLVFKWVQQAHTVLLASDCASACNLHGFDLVQVLASPLFISTLNEMRNKGTSSPHWIGHKWSGSVREQVYKARTYIASRRASYRVHPSGTANVVFWPRDITHIADQIPVSRALREYDVSSDFIACQLSVCKKLSDRGIEPYLMQNAWPDIFRAARAEGSRRSFEVSKLLPAGLPELADIGGPGFREAYIGALAKSIPLACEAIENARAAIDVYRPQVLVVGNDITVEGRAGCAVASALGVPSAVIMHGNTYGNPLHEVHCANEVLVYGESHRRKLVDMGVAQSKIVTCGAPYLDEQPRQTGCVDVRLQRLLGIEDGTPLVLVATSGPGHSVSHLHHGMVLDSIMRLTMRHPEIVFVAKLHRKDRLEHYRDAVARVGNNRLRVIPDGTPGVPASIFEWLQGCRAVLTGSSTVAIEAMLMEVPVITIDLQNELNDIEFIDAGATLHVRSVVALEACLKQVMGSEPISEEMTERISRFLENAFSQLDGRSSLRCAEAIMSQIGSSKS